MRGHVGRKRLRAMRFVRQFSRLAIESVDALKPKVLEELAALVRVDALTLCFVFVDRVCEVVAIHECGAMFRALYVHPLVSCPVGRDACAFPQTPLSLRLID